MFRVFSCLVTEHDLRLLLLAGAICFLASLVAISLFHRAAATAGRARGCWIAMAGAATGCGIWATHFVAMLAYEPGVAVGYDIGLTALSLLAAALITGLGLALAVHKRGWWPAPLGGAILGGGVAVMHYTGMWALQLPGHVTWAADLVIASLLLGMLFGASALTVAQGRDRIQTTFGAAALLALAILSHHFTAMGAAEVVFDPTRSVAPAALSDTALAIAIAGAALAILVTSLVGAIADRFIDRTRRVQAQRQGLDCRGQGRHVAMLLSRQHFAQQPGLHAGDAGTALQMAGERA